MGYRLHEYKSGIESRKFYPGAILEPTCRIFFPDKIRIGKGVYIGHDVKLYGYPLHSLSLTIGDGSWIGANTIIHGAGGVNIGKKVGIGPGVLILSSEHISDGHPCVLSNPIQFKPVLIQSYVDIGSGSKICPGVMIGEGSIIGMGSVVTKNVPSYEIWVGNPAQFLRQRKVESLPNVVNPQP